MAESKRHKFVREVSGGLCEALCARPALPVRMAWLHEMRRMPGDRAKHGGRLIIWRNSEYTSFGISSRSSCHRLNASSARSRNDSGEGIDKPVGCARHPSLVAHLLCRGRRRVALALIGPSYRVVTTASRYSPGTTRLFFPPRFIRWSSSMISALSADCPAESKAANARLVGP